MFGALQAKWKNPDQVLVQKILPKECLSELIFSEIVNDSDSDGDSFSELSDSDTYKVNSPFGSSEEEEVVQPESDRGTKSIRRAIPKRTNTYFDLGWKEQIQLVQKPAFLCVPGMNINFQITQDSSPWDVFEIFFSPEMFRFIQKETKPICKVANKQKETRGLAVVQICICTV